MHQYKIIHKISIKALKKTYQAYNESPNYENKLQKSDILELNQDIINQALNNNIEP